MKRSWEREREKEKRGLKGRNGQVIFFGWIPLVLVEDNEEIELMRIESLRQRKNRERKIG